MNRKPLQFALPLALLALSCAPPAFAVNKDMVQLQTEVQQLQDAVQHLQQSNDERMGALKDLVQQTADSVNKMASTMADLQKRVQSTSEAQTGKADQISGQIQSMNDSIDEIKARLNNLDKALGNIQNQQQQMGAALQSLAPPATGAPATGPGAMSTPGAIAPGPGVSNVPAAPAAPPVKDMYSTAYGDYLAAKFTLATEEFNDVIKFYPTNDLAGNSCYYLGEIEYRAGRFASAVKFYDMVLEQYPGNNKVAAAQLRKGDALIAQKQNDAGARELRSLIQRFPNSPEAAQARAKLSSIAARAR